MGVENREKGNYIQCSQCGHIYWIEEEVPIEKLYVTSVCARCGHDRGLNCGDKEEEVYAYYNPCMDERYYIY